MAGQFLWILTSDGPLVSHLLTVLCSIAEYKPFPTQVDAHTHVHTHVHTHTHKRTHVDKPHFQYESAHHLHRLLRSSRSLAVVGPRIVVVLVQQSTVPLTHSVLIKTLLLTYQSIVFFKGAARTRPLLCTHSETTRVYERSELSHPNYTCLRTI